MSRKPKLLVFDLDYTLWPFHVDTNVSPPFKRRKDDSKIVDTRGCVVEHFKDVPEVLKQLSDEGYELGVASRTSEVPGAKQLLKLFDWDKYFKYKEIYPGCKVSHFSKIQKASGIDYKDMIFFDDEYRNIVDVGKLGVCCIYIEDGVTHTVINDALKQFQSQ